MFHSKKWHDRKDAEKASVAVIFSQYDQDSNPYHALLTTPFSQTPLNSLVLPKMLLADAEDLENILRANSGYNVDDYVSDVGRRLDMCKFDLESSENSVRSAKLDLEEYHEREKSSDESGKNKISSRESGKRQKRKESDQAYQSESDSRKLGELTVNLKVAKKGYERNKNKYSMLTEFVQLIDEIKAGRSINEDLVREMHAQIEKINDQANRIQYLVENCHVIHSKYYYIWGLESDKISKIIKEGEFVIPETEKKNYLRILKDAGDRETWENVSKHGKIKINKKEIIKFDLQMKELNKILAELHSQGEYLKHFLKNVRSSRRLSM